MSVLANINSNKNQKEYTSFLPDINLHSPYTRRGVSENQKLLQSRLNEIMKEKNEDKPINKQAMINKYLKSKLKGNLFISSSHLLANKEKKTHTDLLVNNENYLLNSINDKSDSKIKSNNTTITNLNKSFDYKHDYSIDNIRVQNRLNELSKLYKVENVKNKLAYKDTSKVFSLNKSEKFIGENFQANSFKINNMKNPFSHLEYFASTKSHNMIKDHFKKHSEEVLRFKHLERVDQKKSKQH